MNPRTVLRRVWNQSAKVVFTLGAVALLAACQSTSSTSARPAGECVPVSLAFAGPLTGSPSANGIPPHDGAQLAVNQYNESHADCPIELVAFDTQGDKLIAASVAKKIVDDPRIVGVVGPVLSSETEVMMPVFDAGGLPMVSGSATNPGLADHGWRTFHRVIGNDAAQGPAAAAYIDERMGAKRVAVVDDGELYGKTLADITAQNLADRGVTVALRTTIDPDAPTNDVAVAAAKAAGVDTVYFGGLGASGGRLLKQLREAKIDAAFVGGDGLYSADFVDIAGADTTNAIVTCPCVNSSRPGDDAQTAFFNAFQAAYGLAPSFYSAEYSDAASLLIDAVASGRTTRDGVEDWLTSADVAGLTKQIGFDDRGEVKSSTIFVFKVDSAGAFNQVAVYRDNSLE